MAPVKSEWIIFLLVADLSMNLNSTKKTINMFFTSGAEKCLNLI